MAIFHCYVSSPKGSLDNTTVEELGSSSSSTSPFTSDTLKILFQVISWNSFPRGRGRSPTKIDKTLLSIVPRDGSKPLLGGMNSHKSHLFWCSKGLLSRRPGGHFQPHVKLSRRTLARKAHGGWVVCPYFWISFKWKPPNKSEWLECNLT